VFWRLARLEKRLDLGSATRNATPQAPCTELHGRYSRPKELAQYAKNPGKTRVFERRGQEPNFLMFFQCFCGPDLKDHLDTLACIPTYPDDNLCLAAHEFARNLGQVEI
jgi:hypothetical protein